MPKHESDKRYDMVIGVCIRPAGQERWYDYGGSYADVPLELVTAAQMIMVQHQAALDNVLEVLNKDLMQLGIERAGLSVETPARPPRT